MAIARKDLERKVPYKIPVAGPSDGRDFSFEFQNSRTLIRNCLDPPSGGASSVCAVESACTRQHL